MNEMDPLTPDTYRLKLVSAETGTKHAILDCPVLPDPLPVDDVISITTPVQRSYRVTAQVAPILKGAMRVMVEPVPYVAP